MNWEKGIIFSTDSPHFEIVVRSDSGVETERRIDHFEVNDRLL